MRTIKFRGKRLDNGEWLYGNLVELRNPFNSNDAPACFIMPKEVNIAAPDSIAEQEVVIPDSVGQFTGLLDKNGKEIYEGDIVKTILHDSRRQMFFKVIYSMDYCGFELQEYGRYSGGYLWNFDDFDEGSLIIIGNIHDNPELME